MALKKKKVNRMGKKKTQQDEKAVKNKLESKKSEHNTEKIELINKNIFIETNKKQNQEIENIDSKLEMVSEKKYDGELKTVENIKFNDIKSSEPSKNNNYNLKLRIKTLTLFNFKSYAGLHKIVGISEFTSIVGLMVPVKVT